ncbi:MAG: hypothetical protein LBJ18_00460 [Rickettsiales bacterium]|jgi:hypothetical protein|nr:hypothetical protein [Rickettsiales bacterium]
MKKLLESLKKFKSAAAWTAGYVAALWLIMFVMFGFDLFSLRHWGLLFNVRLHGFAGFAFGLIIVVAIPLYAATVALILRKKTIFDFKKKKPEAKDETPADAPAAPISEPEIKLPMGLPREMLEPYVRAKKRIGIKIEQSIEKDKTDALSPTINDNEHNSLIESSPPQSASQTATSPGGGQVPVPAPIQIQEESALLTLNSSLSTGEAGALPLPDDFDFSGGDSAPAAPVFREISFGDKPAEKESVAADEKYEIAVHDDPDFWIADGEEWFANGKRKPNPVSAVLAAAAEKNLIPVLVLKEKNIMDLDARIVEWETAGVRVVSDAGEL